MSQRWQPNMQMVLTALGVVAILVGWGYTLSSLQNDTDRNTVAVAALTLGLEQNDSQTAQIDTRLVALEKIAGDAIMLRRELEHTLSQFTSDVAVIKEILARLEDRPPAK